MAHYGNTDSMKDTVSSQSKEFTLYVSNLPEELNEYGLMEIFNHYGEVKGHFYRPNSSWAFITYNTYSEAENAIKDLHDILPLCLNVTFAKEKVSNQIHTPKKPTFNGNRETHENGNVRNMKSASNVPMQTKRRDKLLNTLRSVDSSSELSTSKYIDDDDLLYPYPSGSFTYNPYEDADPYRATNALWTRGQLTITQDGKRHVAFGRGYTKYEIPYPKPEIPNYINKVCEKRTSGLYEYGEDTLQNAIGDCKNCSKKAKFICDRCRTFYCSRNCQVADWPQHKANCQSIPALTAVAHSTSISRSNKKEQISSRHISHVQLPLRRPKKLVDASASSKEGVNNTTENQNKNTINAKSFNDSMDNELKENHNHNRIATQSKQVDNSKQFENNHEYVQSKATENDTSHDTENSKVLDGVEKCTEKLQSFTMKDVRQIEEDIAFSKTTAKDISAVLSKSKFTDVRIMVRSGRECWVQTVESSDYLTQLMTHLQNEAEKASKAEPVVGNIYAIRYEGVWQRAKIISANPLRGHFIDYGNDEIVEIHDIREISMKMKASPSLSIKIRLSEKANEKFKDLKYEDIIAVKIISIDPNKVIDVEVQGENDSTAFVTKETNYESQNSLQIAISDALTLWSCKVKSIVDTVSVGDTGVLEVCKEWDNHSYGITLITSSKVSEYEQLVKELPEICETAATNLNHRPQIGEIICGRKFNDDWFRGYVVSLDLPLKMVVLDEAMYVPIKTTVPCPESYLNICSFGAVCNIVDSNNKLKLYEQYHFEVMKVANEVQIEILKDKLKAVLKPWPGKPKETEIIYSELKNESEVCLTAFSNQNLLYARPLDTESLEYHSHIMQNVAKCAQTSPCLKKMPIVGQMVIALYLDENYYRAIVIKVQHENILVLYVDFGNVQFTDITKLKVLPDNLKQLRSCTAKISLKNVPRDVPMTKEVSEYLKILVGTELPLTCTFDGIPSKDGVYLKLHNGDSINEKISKMLIPPSEKDVEEDKTCYMMDDMSVATLGDIGEMVEALVLHPLEESYQYAFCPIDPDLTGHVYDVMPKLMEEYCKANDYYIPRVKELCLALYEGEWYRATCISRNDTPTTCSIFFIDFGNIESVEYKDIRLMPKDFITPMALANLCEIINAGPTDSNGRYTPEIEQKIAKAVVPSEIIKIKLVELDEETGTYRVELPFL